MSLVKNNSAIGLLTTALKMKLKRQSSIEKSNTIEVLPVTTDMLLESANRMKSERVSKMEDPKPLIPQPFAHYKKAFVCTDLFGKQISVIPSNHSIDRFIERYHYVDHFFNIPSREAVINKMRELFNKSTQQTNVKYIERASHRNRPKDMIAWGNENFKFIVNTVTLCIVTFELSGKFSIYNRRD